MRKLLTIGLVLAIVAGTSFGLEVGGSTSAAYAGNADERLIMIDQEIDIDLDALHFDVDGGLDFLLPENERAWDYEIGAAYTISIFTFGATVGGDKDVKLGDVAAYADIVYENVGADIDFLFSADSAKDGFQGAEFSAFCNPEPFEFRVGYMMKSGAVDANTPEALTEGGFYAKAKYSY